MYWSASSIGILLKNTKPNTDKVWYAEQHESGDFLLELSRISIIKSDQRMVHFNLVE